MAARAVWKGVIRLGDERVPVKLYSAVEDRSVHFRLLHETDRVPVRQVLVNPESGERVEYGEAKRGLATDEGDLVVFEQHELEEVTPEKSRDIDVVAFLPEGAIDHRWYVRPYFLGPDGSHDAYAALAAALQESQREGVARWTMRNKEYVGALRIHRGYPMLVTVRSDEQVVALERVEVPSGPELDAKELNMVHQLMGMLEGEFDPDQYRDEYRERVLELIEKKAKGETVRPEPVRREEPRYEDLSEALRASLEQERIRA